MCVCKSMCPSGQKCMMIGNPCSAVSSGVSNCKADRFSPNEGRIQTQAYNPRWTSWSRSPIYLTGNFMWSGGNLGYKFRLTAVKNNFSELTNEVLMLISSPLVLGHATLSSETEDKPLILGSQPHVLTINSSFFKYLKGNSTNPPNIV